MSTDVTEHRRFERGLALILDGFVAKCDLTQRDANIKKSRKRAPNR